MTGMAVMSGTLADEFWSRALPGMGPTSSWFVSSSSLSSSPGRLKTSCWPFTSRRFFRGTSAEPLPPPALPLDSASPSFPLFARSFFFCLLARFFAVFASACSSLSLFFCSNSATVASCEHERDLYVTLGRATYLLSLVFHHLQPFILSSPASLVDMELS